MRLVFIGCVEMSARLLATTQEVDELSVVGVITRSRSPFNSDFGSLKPMAQELNVPCLQDDENDQERMAKWLRRRDPEVAFCFGWSYLLSPKILSIPDTGVIGYHPAALPKNRGRHPIIWALALGLRETASTFFLMDEGADTGDIVDQRPVSIRRSDDASTLYNRLASMAASQIRDFGPRWARGEVEPAPQDDEKANYWRKRSKQDGEIDWRMSSEAIYNLVRALSEPYVGAHCLQDEEEIKIWRVEVVDDRFEEIANLEPGKVLDADGENVVVKTGSGAIQIQAHEFETLPEVGSYLP